MGLAGSPSLVPEGCAGSNEGGLQLLARTDHQQAPGDFAQGAVEESCRKAAIPDLNYRWRSRYGGMTIAEAKEAKRLREENTRLKKVVADQALDIQIRGGLGKLVSPERRRKCVESGPGSRYPKEGPAAFWGNRGAPSATSQNSIPSRTTS